jgi:hypothetical protein
MGKAGKNPNAASHAFVLRPDDLVSLARLLSQSMTHVRFEASCNDASTRTFETYEDLVQYDNPGSRAIETLTVVASNPDKHAAYKALFANSVLTNLTFEVEGPSEMKTQLTSFTRDLFQEIRPWYSKIMPNPFIVGFWVGFGAVAILSWLKTGDGRRLGDLVDKYPLPGTLLISTIGISAGTVAYRFWKWNFPMGAFAIGYGERRHNEREPIRLTLIVSFIVSLCAGLLLLPSVIGFVVHFF